MEINTTTTSNNSQFKKIEISVTNYIELEKTFSNTPSKLPLFCFQEENVSSIEKLNFNNLKQCETNGKNKYMVVFLKDFDETNFQNKLNQLHNKKESVEIKLTVENDENVVFWGKMLKIFHKQYQPTIDTSNS